MFVTSIRYFNIDVAFWTHIYVASWLAACITEPYSYILDVAITAMMSALSHASTDGYAWNTYYARTRFTKYNYDQHTVIGSPLLSRSSFATFLYICRIYQVVFLSSGLLKDRLSWDIDSTDWPYLKSRQVEWIRPLRELKSVCSFW